MSAHLGPGWVSETAFNAVGVNCLVRSTDQAFGADIEHLTMDFAASGGPPDVVYSVIRTGDRYQLFDRGRVRVGLGSHGEVLMRLLRRFNHAAIDRATGLAIHAGAVASGGEVIAFPGPAGTGKSTFVAACMQQGFGYVTDEVVVVGTELQVASYPKALWLSRRSLRVLGVPTEDLTVSVEPRYKAPVASKMLGSVAEPPLRLGHVVVLERNADRLGLEPIDPGDLAYRVLRRAFNRYARPDDWFHLVVDMGRAVHAWRLTYRDPREAAELLDDRLG
jgi:hypothetical protein